MTKQRSSPYMAAFNSQKETEMFMTVRSIARDAVLFMATGALVLGAAGLAVATQISAQRSSIALVEADLPQLITKSSAIVRGEVASSSTLTDGPWGDIFTDTTIRTRQAYRGDVGNLFTVRTRGGHVGLTINRVDDEATLRQGAEVLLFLVDGGASGAWRVYGGFQGRYFVDGQTAFNEKHAVAISEIENLIRRGR